LPKSLPDVQLPDVMQAAPATKRARRTVKVKAHTVRAHRVKAHTAKTARPAAKRVKRATKAAKR
ncbi:MAG: hypothetical protein ABJB78_07015, partial [Betaproteobacteria bacterium]